jgi:class 3 adenylate cyclase
MKIELPFPLLESPEALASCNGWTEEVYRDLLALQAGQLTQADMDAKYLYRKAILTLDLTGFTVSSLGSRQMHGLLRVLDAQKVCVPVLREHNATLVRAFADDLVALFDDPSQALDAAFELHHRIGIFNESGYAASQPALCCIGLGYGEVYRIGPNLAMGDEMNRASKLGEDTARGAETLVTGSFFAAARNRTDVVFDPLSHDDMLFPYYRASRRR